MLLGSCVMRSSEVGWVWAQRIRQGEGFDKESFSFSLKKPESWNLPTYWSLLPCKALFGYEL